MMALRMQVPGGILLFEKSERFANPKAEIFA